MEMAPRFMGRRRPRREQAVEAPGHALTLRRGQDEYGNFIEEASVDERNWQIVHTQGTDGIVQWYPFDPSPGHMEVLNQAIRRNLAENALRRGLIGAPVRLEPPLQAASGDRVLAVGPFTGDIVGLDQLWFRREDMGGTTRFPATVMFQGSVMMPLPPGVRAWGVDEQLRPSEPTHPPLPDLDNPDPNPIPKGVNPRVWGVVEALGKQLKEKKDGE